MTDAPRDPYRQLTDEARALAASLLRGATHCALATSRDGHPTVSRAGCAWVDGALMLLLSDLSDHARHLAADSRAGLLVGEPGAKGDPLTHPRLSLDGTLPEADKGAHRDAFLRARPKSALYYDFTDFRLRRLLPEAILLNGGFGQAFRLAPADLP